MFNQLTSSKLADCSLFTNILDHHYEKFQYLYSLLKGIDLDLIKDISCTESSSHIKVYIKPYENNYINEIIYYINDNKHSYKLWKYFNISIIESKNNLEITISMCDDKKEGDLYEDRFI